MKNISSAENSYLSFNTFKTSRLLNKVEIDNLYHLLNKISGVKGLDVTPESISLEYYTHAFTLSYLKDILMEVNFPFSSEQHEGFLGKFVKKIARSNKEAFGNSHLGCCDLNH